MNKATCKHCKTEYEVLTYTGQARFPNHRIPGSLIACDGTGELVTVAGENYTGPTKFARPGKITGRRGTDIGTRIERSKQTPASKPRPAVPPSFYDKEEVDDDKILF